MHNFFENDLTNTARHATMRDMKTTRARRLPTGDRTSVPRLALSQQAADPVDKSAGGCSPSLIWRRLNLSRAYQHIGGISRAELRLGLADQIVRGEISIAVADAPALPASAIQIPWLGSSLSAERRLQSVSRCQPPPLSIDACLAAADRRSGFKVRDSQTHIHTTERKQ